MDFDPSQLSAIDKALAPGNTIITGGAGTGKTTVIKEIARRLKENDEHPEIMAPTGKAAARLKEATGYDAGTIHRALIWDGGQFRRTWDFDCPVIIDEASMVDSWLMARLLEFKPSKLILVGDASQLPPVGRGQPFHDLLALKPDMTARLTHCWRAQGAVHIACSAIREGKPPAKAADSGGETFTMRETGGAPTTLAFLRKIAESGRYDPATDAIVAPMYGKGNGDGGIRSINKMMHEMLNPRDKAQDSTDAPGLHGYWAVGDRILCLKNFSDLDFWNGDLATIQDIDTKGNLWVEVDRRPGDATLLETEAKREISHAYAMSVHKAQGSQFRRTFFVCLRAHWNMLTRALIYTAVTRTKIDCVVCGQLQAFYHGIKQEEKKRTIIQHLAQEDWWSE